MSDDGWSDEESIPVPKVLGVYRVNKDYIPPSRDELTLEEDNLVYVFNKNPGKPGYWEGEHRGVVGIFPSSYVSEAKTLDQEIREGKAKRL
mmetsp:Transcript_15105/g.47190  ORF Transcript_15105/g.47190 Transcript_15105/m.47190 type:complete len:91 (-) Transcript_15105:233-505(-)